MKTFPRFTSFAALFIGLVSVGSVRSATVIVADTYNVTGSGSGFNLNSGINSGINPPTTRLTGTLAPGLRYINTGTKATTAYTITSNKARVTSAANPGRFTLSANGTTPFDFGPALGTSNATPANPVVYDLAISMDNDSTGIQRFSFALGTAEGDATTWDFGIQVYRATSTDNFYTIGKRIDTGSSGLASDLNAAIITLGANTYGTEITLLMRVTDAGSESATFNSRVQLSLNGGSTWFYDTASDPNLPNGWRLNGTGRYIMWDVAPDAGNVTYDNFSLNWVSGPHTWTGAGANGNWSNSANWGGTIPGNGDMLVFNGTTRQTSTNDISGLTVPWLTFNNGGFTLYGNSLTNSGAITNLAGNNTFKEGLAWSTTAAKTWHVANGSELILDNTSAVEVNGDHSVYGGGTLRLKGTMNIGQATTANPAFIVNEGKHTIDGGTFTSRGGYRIGSMATGAGAQLILTNGANFTLTTSAGNLRVGDSANPNTSRLTIDNSSLAMSGGILTVPFAAGATGTVAQTGGTVSGCTLSFSDAGAGSGSYTIKDGTLEVIQVRENTPSGSASIYFDNAILRPASGANSAFMTGLNLAQIQSGGLTIDATADITIGQVLSGSGALTKSSNSKLTLTGASTYTGNTTISAGTLALGTSGSVANSSSIVIGTGTTFDISAVSGYTVAASQTLARNANSGNGSINGSIVLSSGAAISLQANGTNGSIGTLSITGGLTLSGNTIAINVTGGPLDLGSYTLLTYTGSKSGSFNATPIITGSGLAAGLAAKIVETSGLISVKVYVPAHGVAAGSIRVIENDLGNTTNSVTVTASTSINGFQVRAGSSRGDFSIQVGASGTDDLTNGVLISSVAENGRDHGEDSGTNYCTSAISFTSGGYFIPVAAAPAGTEYNINVAAAYFPYTKWLGGYARNSAGTNGGPNNLFTGSPGLVLGTHFVDNGGGISTVNLTSLGIDSRTDGILLVTEGSNQDKYALSWANTNNGTWTVYVKDNGTNGATTEQDPIAFAFIPKTNVSVISGKFQGDGSILRFNGTTPRFSVTNVSTGNWKLTIPGYSPKNGVLVISAEGGDSVNQDNIVSYQPSGNDWIIQSRDVPGNGLQTPAGPVASFVFVPAPAATLVSPANGVTNISSSPTLTVAVSNNIPGNLTVTFSGHEAGKPYPGPDFLIPVLPDTQNYAREAAGIGDAVRGMWYAQTDWIVAHANSDNIPYVMQLGDIVQNGDILNGNPNDGEWRIATNAMYRLEDQSSTLRLFGIPYGCAVGNHDQEPNGDPDGTTTHYNQYFGTAHFSGKPYYGGHFSTNGDSFYDLFSVGGLDFIAISFEFERNGSTILNWASDLLDANPNRRVIFFTHHAGSDSTPSNLSDSGQAFFDRFSTNKNFFLMLGGHVFNGGGDGEGSRSDTVNGHEIHTLISDYQGRANGGNGLMRLMYFSPSNNLVQIKTYSPWTGQYETDGNSQFSFSYNMQLPSGPGSPGTPYAALGTNANVAPGSQTGFVWSGLQPGKTYEWYVTVANEVGDFSTSSEWQFTTTAGFSRPAPGNPSATSLPADWKSKYGVTDPNADDDGDGQSNLAEYRANTNPTNEASVFKIMDAKWLADGHFKITWSSSGGTRYRVQYLDGGSNGVITGSFTDIVRDEANEIDASPSGETSTQTFTDTFVQTTVPTNGVRYYRIKVIP